MRINRDVSKCWNAFPAWAALLFCNNLGTLHSVQQNRCLEAEKRKLHFNSIPYVKHRESSCSPFNVLSFSLNHHQNAGTRLTSPTSLLEESNWYQCYPSTFCNTTLRYLAELTLTSRASEGHFMILQALSLISRCQIIMFGPCSALKYAIQAIYIHSYL